MEMLSEKDLAARWGVTQKTLQVWRTEGDGPKFITLGKNTIRYRMDDVLAYEAERTKTKPEETKND